jgi:hypothetical protein
MSDAILPSYSLGGMALCGPDLYYAGPNLFSRVAHIG